MDEKLRILLCEDDENLGMLLREYLQAKGYSADLFPDGEAGFKAFLKNKYDLVVTDVMMPKKDGFTLAQEIRQANAEIPIIFLTAKTLKRPSCVVCAENATRNATCTRSDALPSTLRNRSFLSVTNKPS